MVTRKKTDEKSPEFSPWQIEAMNLAADAHSHVSVGENSMAFDSVKALLELLNGETTKSAIELPYQVHCRWREDGQIRNRMVIVETTTRTLANQLAAFRIQDLFGLGNVTSVSTVVVPPGTTIDDEAEIPTDAPAKEAEADSDAA